MKMSPSKEVQTIPYKTAFVVNPASGNGDAAKIWRKVASELEQNGQEYRAFYTRFPGEGTTLTEQAAREGAELVVAVGGDGTLGEVVNGLDLNKNILGLIPAGTGNGFRRSCEIPRQWRQALHGLAAWPPRRIDLGVINKRLFLNVAGVGLDAAVAQKATGKYRNMKGYLPFAIAFIEEYITFKPFHARVEGENLRLEEKETLAVVAANGTHYAGKFSIAPQALIDDGMLDLCLVKKTGPFELINLGARVPLKKHEQSPAYITARTTECRIDTDRDLPVHVDGDVIGSLPADIGIKPGALRILAPDLPVTDKI